MRWMLMALLVITACGDTPQKDVENNSNGSTNNPTNGGSNNDPTNNEVNNVPTNNANNDEGLTRFTLRNNSGKTVLTPGGTSWITVKNSGQMAFLWTPTCTQCICDSPCSPCETPPELPDVEIPDGQTRSITWDGNRLAYNMEGSCYASQAAEGELFYLEFCYVTQGSDNGVCTETPFYLGEHVDVSL